MRCLLRILPILVTGILLAREASAQVAAQIHTHRGEQFSSEYGVQVAACGDVNLDGFPDYVVSSSGYSSNPGAGLFNTGRVYLYSGQDGASLAILEGDLVNNEFFGTCVGGGGDANNDGHPDILVGSSAGVVWVFSGKDASVIHRFQPDNWGISQVSFLDDVNADGHDDFLASRFGWGGFTGQLQLYSGMDAQAIYALNGQQTGETLGRELAAVGDLDSDGISDFVMGSPNRDIGPNVQAGAIAVHSGIDGQLIDTITGTRATQRLGGALSNVGDLNQDGFADFLAGDLTRPVPDLDTGIVWAYSGKDRSVLAQWTGWKGGQWFGRAVAGPGDVDNDGTPDILIGARTDPDLGTKLGASFVYSGADRSLLWRSSGVGQDNSSSHGAAVSGVGDVDQDNHADFLVGALRETGVWQGGSSTGWAVVFSGNPSLSLADPSPGQAGIDNDFVTTGGNPGEQVQFFASKKTAYTTFGACPDTVRLGLSNPFPIGSAIVQGSGQATLTVFIPGSLSGKRFLLQAAKMAGCVVSNPVVFRIP